MNLIVYILTVFLTVGICSCNNSGKKEQKKDGIIQTIIPQRPAGQEDLVGFRCDPIKTVRIGFIGLGMRGPGAVKRFIIFQGLKSLHYATYMQIELKKHKQS